MVQWGTLHVTGIVGGMLQCAQNPVPIGVGYLAQYIIKPLLGFMIAKVTPAGMQPSILFCTLPSMAMRLCVTLACALLCTGPEPVGAPGHRPHPRLLLPRRPGGTLLCAICTLETLWPSLPACRQLCVVRHSAVYGPAFRAPGGMVCRGNLRCACGVPDQASNVATYIAHGDVALSVLMTTASTLGAIFMTPLLTAFLAGQLVPVDARVRPRCRLHSLLTRALP